MIKYHKCSLCGKITDNFNSAVNHALSHAYVTRSYAESKGFYACPVCNICHDTKEEMESCITSHIFMLRQLGYIKEGDTLQ